MSLDTVDMSWAAYKQADLAVVPMGMQTRTAKLAAAKKIAAAKRGGKPKFGSPEWNAKYGIKRFPKKSRKADMAITPGGRVGDASPLARPGYTGPRRLTDYEREVAHALMRKGIPKRRAIAMARGILNHAASRGKWGKGKVRNPAVRAGAVAERAQRASFSNENVRTIDLAKLSKAERDRLPDSAFVFPKKRAFPIHDRPHAKAAMRLAGRKGPKIQAAVRAAVKRRYPGLVASLANDPEFALTFDFGEYGSKWKHGYIPLNAEAVALKEHRKPGGGVSKASYKKYHSDKSKLSNSELAAHAKLHGAAAARARSSESKAKHTAEAKSSVRELAKRKAGTARTKSATSTKSRTVSKPKAPTKPRTVTKPKPVTKPPKVKMPPRSKGTYVKDGDISPEELLDTKYKNLDATELDKLIRETSKLPAGAARTRKLNELNREVAKRLARKKRLDHEAYEARKLVHKHWTDPKAPLELKTEFFTKLADKFPILKKFLNKIRDKEGHVSSRKVIEKLIDEAESVAAHVLLTPVLVTGLTLLGVHFGGGG